MLTMPAGYPETKTKFSGFAERLKPPETWSRPDGWALLHHAFEPSVLIRTVLP